MSIATKSRKDRHSKSMPRQEILSNRLKGNRLPLSSASSRTKGGRKPEGVHAEMADVPSLSRKNPSGHFGKRKSGANSGALRYNVKKVKEDDLMTSGINRRDFLKASARAGLLLSFGAGNGIGSLSTTSYDIIIGDLAGKLLYGPGKK
jgi:hypothetical protein